MSARERSVHGTNTVKRVARESGIVYENTCGWEEAVLASERLLLLLRVTHLTSLLPCVSVAAVTTHNPPPPPPPFGVSIKFIL